MRQVGVMAAVGLMLAVATPIHAAPKPQGPMQTCTAQWLTMRDASDLHGQTYQSFIRLCLDGKTSDWTPAVTVSRAAPSGVKTVRTASQGGNRMKMCGAKWQAMKAANATSGQTWRQFSSQCLRTH